MKFNALRQNSDGTFSPVEIYGPNSFALWDQAWTVFRTGCVMLGTISTGTLDAYRTRMHQLSQTIHQRIHQIKLILA